MTDTRFAFFAACAPGLEALLLEELRHLQEGVKAIPGGVEGRATLGALRNILTHSRLAESLRIRLRAFRATDFPTLERELARLPWHAYLTPSTPFDVAVTCHKSRLYHSDAVAQRVTSAVTRRFARAPKAKLETPDAVSHLSESASDPSQPLQTSYPEQPKAQIHVRLEHDVVQVSIDASGERLHRRGYRTHVVEAPLRETLAAAMARLALRRGAQTQLWNPFCGSGTLALEWLGQQCGMSLTREHYAMDHWPIAVGKSDVVSASSIQAESPDQIAPAVESPYHAWLTDTDPRALAAAQHNARQAGLDTRCTFTRGDFETALAEVPRNSAVLANPPYGVRLDSGKQASDLFRRFTQVLVSRPDLRPAIAVAPYEFASVAPGRHWEVVAKFPNGGLNVCALALRS